MANELQLSLNIAHTKNPKLPFNPGLTNIDQTGTGVFCQPVDVTTTAATVAFAGISTPGVVVVWNLDATNIITVGVDVSGTPADFGELKPGGFPAVIPWKSGATLSLKSDTSACECHVQVYEA